MRQYAISLIILTLILANPFTSAKEEPVTPQAEIMLFGVFHFANPGMDKVKSEQVDVTTTENQAYLEKLATRLANFKPTQVLIECDPTENGKYASEYAQFRQDKAMPSVNENYQLGFRIAQASGIGAPICYDERTIGWAADQLFADLETKALPAKKRFDQVLSHLTEESKKNHQTLSLKELLRLSNNSDKDRQNKQLYIMTNDVGAGDNYSGADAAASWWHRNFRMYANIQKVAQPGTRIIVIGGQGHTAILKDLVDMDGDRKRVDILSYF